VLKTAEADELVKTTLDNYMESGCDVCGEAYHSNHECGCTETEINLYLDYLENEDMGRGPERLSSVIFQKDSKMK
jgi:hypothetical protein